MHRVFLLLGSNLGDRTAFINEARRNVTETIGPVLNQSSVYETQSWGETVAPDYLNQVLIVETSMAPRQLLESLLDIEKIIGRVRQQKWGPRVIDIDILFFDNQVVEEPGLSIPHPELHKRRFTLEPLNELAPDMRHPILNKQIKVLKAELSDNLYVKRIN